MADVLTSIDNSVGVVSFNRPDHLNAWTAPMAKAYRKALLDFDADPSVRVVVVTGEGREFCSGSDTGNLCDISAVGGSIQPQIQQPSTEPALVPDPLAHVPDPVIPSILSKPVIACINGSAAGIGMGLTMWCDIRFVADEAMLTTAFARLGAPAEMGLAYLLAASFGPSRAADLLFSSREISGLDAFRMGLVQHHAPAVLVKKRAMEYASTMAAEISPRSLAMMKQQLWADHNRTLAEALKDSLQLKDDGTSSADLAEGVAALANRRQPRFAPPERPRY